MNELQGLLIESNEFNLCAIVNDRVKCPRAPSTNIIIPCRDCIYCTKYSPNHTKLIELIPILLLEES